MSTFLAFFERVQVLRITSCRVAVIALALIALKAHGIL